MSLSIPYYGQHVLNVCLFFILAKNNHFKSVRIDEFLQIWSNHLKMVNHKHYQDPCGTLKTWHSNTKKVLDMLNTYGNE